MATITRPNSYTSGTTIQSSQVNADFNTIYNDYNGNVTNANIASGAAIAASKLSLGTIAQTITMSGVAVNWADAGNLASATTTNIGAAAGNKVNITGVTTITAFDTVQAGTVRFVRFTGILTLTHNGTSLILPSAANITTAAGDCAIFISEGSGNWRCWNYSLASGAALVGSTVANALSGSVIQTVTTETGAYATGSTATPYDDTIPQITEGDQYMTLAITPNNTSNLLHIRSTVTFSVSQAANEAVALFQDSTASALATVGVVTATNNMVTITFTHVMTAGTTSSTTFRIRIGGDAGTVYFNGKSAARIYGGVCASSMIIQEIKA